jgi:putative pyoverdin transport system ATP-binding/permease protein
MSINSRRSKGKNKMKLIQFMMQHSRRAVILAVLGGIVGGAASTALLFVINAGLGPNAANSQRLLYIFLALAGTAMLTRAGAALLLASIGQAALFKLRMTISHQILGVPLRKLEEVGTPRLLAILTDDIPNIMNAVGNVPVICVNIAALLTCLAFLAWSSWQLFAAVIVLMAIGAVTYQLPIMAASKQIALGRQEHNNVLSHLRSLISGVKELKLNRNRRKVFFTDRLEASAARFQNQSMAAMKIYVLGATWGELLSFVTIGLLVFVSPHVTHVNGTTLSGFVIILLYLMGPIEYLMNQAPQFSKASVALRSVEEMGLTLGRNMRDESPALDNKPAREWNRLELSDLGFGYGLADSAEKFILGPVNLSFRPGELVFFAGGNGSGKTTLAKLLVGLYAPEQGKIMMDGEPVTDGNRDWFRQHFAAIFSDYYLFDSLFGVEQRNLDERAALYVDRLQLKGKVEVKEGALSTLDLSQGQRKRLALLTAYMEDRPIFLFDEWAADQDTVFKEIFYQQLLPELKAQGKAIFVISHDERYYPVADRIVRLEDGHVVSDDRHNRGPAPAPKVLSAVKAAH